MNFTTEKFRLTPSAYVSVIMGRWLVRNAWVFVLLFVGTIVGAFAAGPVFLYVGLMLLFLVFPTVLMLVYFNYALKPEARAAISPCHAVLSDEAVTIIHESDEDNVTPVFDDITVPYSSVRDIRGSRERLVLIVGKHIDDVVIIPVKAFGDDKRALNRFIEDICRTIQRNSLNLQS